MDFETETPAGYITIEQAVQTRTSIWESWELYPGTTLPGLDRHPSTGDIVREVEVTDRARIAFIELWNESGTFVLYGDQDGERFVLEVNVDFWTPVRLVDER